MHCSLCFALRFNFTWKCFGLFFERIMNGRSVSEYQQDEKESSKLVIPRTYRNMTGEVKCRVYNDYGAEFSDAAKITVISKCVTVIYTKSFCG